MLNYDVANLKKLRKMADLAPAGMAAYNQLSAAAMAEGAIPVKYKELMALAVAFTTQCVYCIDHHAKKAKEAGVTDQEITEAALVSAALRAGASMTHATHALD